MPTIQQLLFFYLFFFIFCNKKTIVTIHNINTYYVYPSSLKRKIKFFIRKIILIKTFGVNVLGEELKRELQKKGFKKLILNIPARIYKEKNKMVKTNKKFFVISIPGSFDLKRRDYKIVYNVYKKLINEGKNIKINFLGNCKTKKKIEHKLLIEFKKIGNIFYKEEFISEKEFFRKLNESDVLLSPTVIDFEYDGIFEKYGITKQTGFVFTQIQFAKISIIPQTLKTYKKLESSTLFYRNEESLYNILLKLYSDKEYKNELQKKAIINSNKFKLKDIKKDVLKN